MGKKNKTLNQCVIQNYSTSFGFKKTDKTYRMSFVFNCFFWETRRENVFITDYDITNDIDLKVEDCVMLFMPGRGTMKISNELMCNEKAMNLIIDDFYKRYKINRE